MPKFLLFKVIVLNHQLFLVLELRSFLTYLKVLALVLKRHEIAKRHISD